MPNTITSIKSSAFANCKQLENITLSSNLTFIANNAFDNCPKLIEYIQDNITADTTWGENKKIYIIKNSFQIKQQTKLEIAPGTVVLGNGATITNFGDIIAHGESDSPIKCFNLHFGLRQGTMDFEYLELRTGSFSNGASSSSNSYGLKFNACSFYDSTEYSYIWYPKLLDIQNCYFENWDKLSIGTSLGTGRGATIMYNTFVNSGTIECWAAYGEIVKVNYNNFINPKSYALSVKYDSGRMDGKYNWFGTTDIAKIERLIYDGNDDFELNTIDYSEYLIKKYE